MRALLALLISSMLFAKVNITKDIPYVDIDIDGEIVRIERIQNQNHRLKNSYTRTSRPTPPFYVQPFTPVKGVETFGELEVIYFLRDKVSENEGLLIDARLNKWYKEATIPSALNIPFNLLLSKDKKLLSKLLDLLDVDTTVDPWDFSEAKELVIFDNGPWCQQATVAIKALIRLGYPKKKIGYYRGGMQFWQIVGLTIIKNGGRE
jgi:rhodanese-related sulfurtransferase